MDNVNRFVNRLDRFIENYRLNSYFVWEFRFVSLYHMVLSQLSIFQYVLSPN